MPRYGHSCGKFTLNNGTEVIIVAGGQTGTNMASKIRHIEVFDIQVSYKKYLVCKMIELKNMLLLSRMNLGF